MGGNNRGAAVGRGVDSPDHLSFFGRSKIGGRLLQQQDTRVADKRSGHGQEPPLSSGQFANHTAIAVQNFASVNYGVVALRKALDEVVQPDGLADRFNIPTIHPRVAERDVVGDGAIDHPRVLQCDHHSGADDLEAE